MYSIPVALLSRDSLTVGESVLRISRRHRHDFFYAVGCFISLLLCPVFGIAVRRGSLSECFNISSHAPTVELMHIVLRAAPWMNWVKTVTRVHSELAAVVYRRDCEGTIIAD